MEQSRSKMTSRKSESRLSLEETSKEIHYKVQKGKIFILFYKYITNLDTLCFL